MLTDNFRIYIESILSKFCHTTVKTAKVAAVSGGSINSCVRLFTNAGDYFLKYNLASNFPGMFEAEFSGLKLLASVHATGIPQPLETGIFENYSWLLMDFIIAGKRNPFYSKNLGLALARLHRNNAVAFGLDHNNYIGSLPQANNLTVSGCDFMISFRFRPLTEMAFSKKLLSTDDLKLFDSFYKKLPDLLPDEKPALLHGDLWSGNVIPGPDGNAWLIDPSVYYGYRETDLAMSLLFGGFDSDFYESYLESYPPEADWEERVGMFQIYPLLVHLNLFGSGYRNAIMQELKSLL